MCMVRAWWVLTTVDSITHWSGGMGRWLVADSVMGWIICASWLHKKVFWKLLSCRICPLAAWWTSNPGYSSCINRLFINAWIKFNTIKERQSNKRIGKSFEHVLHKGKYSNNQLIYEESHNFVTSKMQNKTRIRFYYTPIRLANVKKSD